MDFSFINNNLLLIPLIVLELILKGIALWKSAKAEHKYWFITIFLINTLGILPGIYLLFFQKNPIYNLKQLKDRFPF